MTIKYKFRNFLCFALLIGATLQLKGQMIDDWEIKPGVAIEHEFANGIDTRIRYRHSHDDNMQHYKGSAIDFKIEYSANINDWLETSIDYRYKINKEKNYQDIRLAAKLKQQVAQNFELAFSPKIQQKIYHGAHPELYLRNKIELTYQLSAPWSVSVFSENYQLVDGGIQFDTQKDGIEAEYDINNNNEIEVKMDLKNNSNHEDIGRLTLTYTYIID